MVFSSLVFLCFFLPACLLFYYISPARLKNTMLLLFSLLFYWWNKPEYVFLILFSIALNYLGGIWISSCRRNLIKKAAFIIVLCMNILLLVIFKYTDFIITNINLITHGDIPLPNIILPIGISFFTFQGISYICDVYMGKCSCCKNPVDTALYISLFPQLVAGPIVKYNEISHELTERHVSIHSFSDGIMRFIAGLSKKVLIANVLGETADGIFNMSDRGIDCPSAWLGIICYTLQIYFDFSGYSDMAIGLGRLFGFTFPENFNYPYISKSITEFWRRWHISLSTWFRDYIYIPLGGSRRGNQSLHLLIVFFITGLWHGASWNFILWGGMYGVLLVIEKPFSRLNIYKKIPSFLKWLITIIIVMTGWVLFRAPDLDSALKYILMMYGIGSLPPGAAHFSYMYYLDKRLIFTLIAALPACIPVFREKFNYLKDKYIFIRILQIIFAFLLLITCIIYIANSVYNPFIYFQF